MNVPAGVSPPPAAAGQLSATEMEEASIALAYQLQMEEAGGLPHHGGTLQMETSGAEDDESLQLAIRLQQEELQWHGAAGGAAAGGGGEGEMDEDMRLAMQLSQQQDDAPM